MKMGSSSIFEHFSLGFRPATAPHIPWGCVAASFVGLSEPLSLDWLSLSWRGLDDNLFLKLATQGAFEHVRGLHIATPTISASCIVFVVSRLQNLEALAVSFERPIGNLTQPLGPYRPIHFYTDVSAHGLKAFLPLVAHAHLHSLVLNSVSDLDYGWLAQLNFEHVRSLSITTAAFSEAEISALLSQLERDRLETLQLCDVKGLSDADSLGSGWTALRRLVWRYQQLEQGPAFVQFPVVEAMDLSYTAIAGRLDANLIGQLNEFGVPRTINGSMPTTDRLSTLSVMEDIGQSIRPLLGPKLERLSLRGVSVKTLDALMRGGIAPKFFQLASSELPPGVAEKLLAGSFGERLQDCELRGCTAGRMDWPAGTVFPELARLDLSGSEIGLMDTAQLSPRTLPKLHSLTLEGGQWDASTAVQLCLFETIQKLSIGYLKDWTASNLAQAVEALSTDLSLLVLQTSQDVSPIVKALSKADWAALIKLDISGLDLDDKDLRALTENDTFDVLELLCLGDYGGHTEPVTIRSSWAPNLRKIDCVPFASEETLCVEHQRDWLDA